MPFRRSGEFVEEILSSIQSLRPQSLDLPTKAFLTTEGMKFVVRPLARTKADVQEIWSLYGSEFKNLRFDQLHELDQHVRKVQELFENATLVAQTSLGMLPGYATYGSKDLSMDHGAPSTARTLHQASANPAFVFVHPSIREQGIGRALVREILALAASQGHEALTGKVNPHHVGPMTRIASRLGGSLSEDPSNAEHHRVLLPSKQPLMPPSVELLVREPSAGQQPVHFTQLLAAKPDQAQAGKAHRARDTSKLLAPV